VYRRRPGSVPVEQRKKVDLAGNPAVRWCPEQGDFLQPTDTTPNVGVKSGGREEEREWNKPTPPGGLYSGERGGHASVLVDSVGPPSAEVCRTIASFP
jgi:hypothetical protein